MPGYSDLLEEADLAWIWSADTNVRLERELWLHVLKFHIDQKLVPAVTIEHGGTWHQYFDVRDIVNLESIKQRELITRHDVKARIEEFNALAGVGEYIHLGMTSADVVDNIALLKMKMTLDYLHRRFDVPMMTIPFRGIKGAVGTQQDQLDLLGTPELCDELDRYVATQLGWIQEDILVSVGQVYPRSIDFMWANHLVGYMPLHGANDRLLGAYSRIAQGFLTMTAGYSGDQWNEGDVSTSVIRRVALPGLAAVACLAHQHQQQEN